ncbi:MAG: CARDB domain-containing protein, partial [Candidatus Thermoplasmatota archaeon]
LHIGAKSSLPSGPSSPLAGNSTHFLGQYWPSLSVRGSYTGMAITPDPAALAMFDRADGSADAITFEDAALQERIAVYPWEFSRIENLAEQSKMVFKVIMWLGNITQKQGKDYAVVTQSFSRNVVFFRDPVNVTAVIRNNGATGGVVEVGAYLDDLTLINITDAYIPGDGGEWIYTTTWWANETGTHDIAVIADPNKIIAETNENNNRVAGYIQSTEIIVQFRLLVIDDDESANNGGTLSDETTSFMSALYAFQCNNESLVVPSGADGPGIQKLNNYSAVLWITGDSMDGLRDDDEAAIAEYLRSAGRLWLHGANATYGIQNATILSALGISSNYSAPFFTYLSGIRYDAVGHGVLYRTNGGQCSGLVPSAGTGFLLSNNDYVGVRVSAPHRSVVTTFPYRALGGALPGEIEGDDARAELAYMILRWLGRPEERSELRITQIDIGISDMHPQIGSAYVIQATVRNIGGYEEASALVRFMDGTMQIGADVVGVLPDANATAEMVWIPLAAGQRTLTVLVDPLGEQPEVFEWFNNNASISIYVYFFYDDMEQGTAKWTHYSTVLNINGEGPIDFLPSRADTDIISNWNVTDSVGLNETELVYHTYPKSFWLKESSVGEEIWKPDKYIYEFYLPNDGSAGFSESGHQGFFVVGTVNPSTFDILQCDNNGDWQPLIMSQSINVGEIKTYIHDFTNPLLNLIDCDKLYRIESTGPLFIVEGSDEGGFINIVSYENGLYTGKNFAFMGRYYAATPPFVKLAIFGMQDATTVTVKYYEINTYH